MEPFASWPLSAWLALLPLAGHAFWKPATALLRHLRGEALADATREQGEVERLTARVADLEELIDLLRKALDKHLIRESAVVTMAELAISVIEQLLDHFDEPPAAVLRTLERALELQRMASEQLKKINEGDV